MRKNNLLKFFSIFIILIIFSSCSTVYKYNMVHSPQITEKNEFNLGGHISSSVLEVHTSYSPINNLAVALSTSVTGNSITVLNNIEGSIGCYNKINEHLFYESYLCYGHGNT
ncbi:MAG: hypothetical protein ACK4ON_06340 [Bacteroidia bacterium]